jgi:opacity protein-like surface antigen
MKENYKKFLTYLIPVALLATGLNIQAKDSIKGLTSDKSAKKAEPKIPESRNQNTLNKHSIGIGIGQTFLMSKFSTYGDDEITWDLFYNYSASHSFDFIANFHSSKHSFEGQYTQLNGLALGIKGKTFQFDNFSPFGMGGFGFYNPKVKRNINGVPTESRTKITFGFHIGAGVDLRLNNKFTVGAMATYHNPFDQKQENQPDVEGSYFKLLMNTFYTF